MNRAGGEIYSPPLPYIRYLYAATRVIVETGGGIILTGFRARRAAGRSSFSQG